MRILTLITSLVLALAVFSSAADARPPFFIRYVDVKETKGNEEFLKADLVNPRDQSVLVKAYVRSKDLIRMSASEKALPLEVKPGSLLMRPASRRAVEVRLADLEGFAKPGTYELVLEQQPIYFSSGGMSDQPDVMTVTTYQVEFTLEEFGGELRFHVGETRRELAQAETK